MTPRQPTTELDARYSSALNPRPGAENVTATDWAEAQRRLRDAEVFQVGGSAFTAIDQSDHSVDVNFTPFFW